MPVKWLPHLHHASMAAADRQMMEQVRTGDVGRDWGSLSGTTAKASGDWALFHYHGRDSSQTGRRS